MSDSLEPLPDPEQQLARQSATQPGSLLRLRDVQALNRSFRRLAEVQEALLDRLETLEEEKAKGGRLQGPLMAIGGVVLGCGMALIAFVMWQGKESTPVVVQQDPAVVNVPTPEVVVQAPDNTELAAALEEMNRNMSKVFEAQEADREQLGTLTEKLLSSEEEKLRLMREFALAEDQYRQDLAAADDRAADQEPFILQKPDDPNVDSGSPAAASSVVPERSWVAAVNGLLAADGYSSLRLQKASRLEGEAALGNVTWMAWNPEGLVESIIHAERLDLEMHHMTRNLVLRFHDGSRTANGMRSALPAGGLRLDLESSNPEAWMEHFPELGSSTSSAPPNTEVDQDPGIVPSNSGRSTPPVGNFLNEARHVKKALDDLISPRGSFSYYRLSALDSLDGRLLRLVQINWHDNSGRLVKTIEADSLEVLLHPNDSVELLLRNGAFLDGSIKSPFSSDRFSLHLPRQDLSAWRSSGVPYTEVEN
ncbi:MAG: hypothetical protein ACYTEP_09870 [Planctomycetota bacterium]